MAISPLLLGLFLLVSLVEVQSLPFLGIFRQRSNSGVDTSLIEKDSLNSDESNAPSDWLTVDPYAILSTLTDAGEHVFADSLYQDLKTFQKVVHCKESKLHIIQRDVILQNVTIGYRKQPPLATIGRLRLRWKSYSDPTFSIEIDDVDVLIRFENMFLTQTNWNRFCDKVFPKHDESRDDHSDPETEKEKGNSSSWIRIASICFGGKLQIRIRSRPLRKDLGVLVYNASDFRDISAAIKKQSQSNLWLKGKAGLPLSELRVMTECVFLKKAHLHAIAAIHEFSHSNPQEAIRLQLDQVLYKVTEALNNAAKATEKTALFALRRWKKSRWASKLSWSWPKGVCEALASVTKDTGRRTKKFLGSRKRFLGFL